MNGFTPFDEAGHMAQMEAGFAAFRAATAQPADLDGRPYADHQPEPEKKRLKVRITYTVEVDQEAYADYYGIDNTATSVRGDVQQLLGGDAVANMAPHLFDEGIIQ
jgi:hypothetical protein